MKLFPYDELELVGAWSAAPPPVIPWRPLRPVFQHQETKERVWAIALDDSGVHGFGTPEVGAEIGELDELTPVEPRGPARRGYSLVHGDEGYEYLPEENLYRRKREVLDSRLQDALAALLEDRGASDVLDSFDAAWLVDPMDRVGATMRAGAAQLLREQEPEWAMEAVTDLDRAVQHSGDLDIVPRMSFFTTLSSSQRELAERLFRHARAALDDFVAPELAFESAVPANVIEMATKVSGLQSSGQLQLSHAQLVAALRGEPEAVEALRERTLVSASVPRPLSARGDVSGMRAHSEDIERMARAWYKLELELGSADRRSSWRGFLRDTAALPTLRDSRPWRRGELMAGELRRHLGLNGQPVHSTLSILRERGVAVATSLTDQAVRAAGTSPRHLAPCALVSSDVESRGLGTRFSLAHELAHFLGRDRHGGRTWICPAHKSESYPETESEANAFAAYFLAPRHSVQEVVGMLPPLGSQDFKQKVLEVRRHFGLTAGQATEHVVNCCGPGVSREPLPRLREEIQGLAKQEPPTDFDEDRPATPPQTALQPPAGSVRRGEFAAVVEKALHVGVVSEEEAQRLLGCREVRPSAS